MTWRTISDTEIDSDSPITQTLMFAMRDNQEAIAQGLSGSPMVYAGWHPYDAVTVGDGADGEIWSFASDGAVASVETPTFVDGYEYAIVLKDVQSSASGSFIIGLYRETDAAYTDTTIGGTFNSGDVTNGILRVAFPRVLKRRHLAFWEIPMHSSTGADLTGATRYFAAADATLQAISKVKIDPPGNFDTGGSIHLLRRREYYTG